MNIFRRRQHLLFAAGTIAVLILAPALRAATHRATTADEEAVLGPINAMFDGMSKRDPAAIKAAVLPGGMMVLMRDGKPAQMTFEEFAERVGKPGRRLAQSKALRFRLLHAQPNRQRLLNSRSNLAVAWSPDRATHTTEGSPKSVRSSLSRKVKFCVHDLGHDCEYSYSAPFAAGFGTRDCVTPAPLLRDDPAPRLMRGRR